MQLLHELPAGVDQVEGSEQTSPYGHGFDGGKQEKHTQAVATKLKLHFVSLFIIQQHSESRYCGNQASSCPAVIIMNKE